jgi:Cys-tRNA(Pro)/Cys-tRNA(Cys) deacylase
VQGLTGYLRGAVTVLAARHAYPVFVDETVELWPQVGISGGAHGLELILAPAAQRVHTAGSYAERPEQVELIQWVASQVAPSDPI